MSHYQGDSVLLILPLQRLDGTSQSVSTAPKITILRASDGSTAQASTDMQVLAGSTYRFAWNTAGVPDDTYVAFVSYVADGLVVQDKFLKDFQLGDSRITEQVALDRTVAKDATVAKAATVLNRADYVSPEQSVLVQAIKAALDGLPPGIASQAALDNVLTMLTDVRDSTMGTLIVNKADHTMTMLRRDNSPLQVFQLENTDEYSSRVRV